MGLKHGLGGVQPWTDALIRRFKEAPAIALRKLQGTKYTVDDARSDRSLRAFTAEVIRYAKAAEFDKPV
jgi:hypothetical protein